MTKRSFLLLLGTLFCWTINARTIDVATAQKAANNFLSSIVDREEALSLAHTYNDSLGNKCFYVFNIDSNGFILVGADDRCNPILGWSMNGCWNEDIPANFAFLLECYRKDISNGIVNNIAPIAEHLKAWHALLNGNTSDYTHEGAKGVNQMLTTQWGQGYGFNRMTPMYNGEHVVVGCVALAMAQIMHYHGYPTHGFGSHRYVADYYGMMEADFYNSTYDHSMMPDEVSYYSTTEAEMNALSLFCFHCGVAINMIYENPNHTSGSGAYSSNVPKSMEYFGYFHVHELSPLSPTEQGWHEVLRPELEAGRPIYTSGVASDGGHAFVCDGYSADGTYHFNYGWNGWCDGYYTLAGMLYSNDLTFMGGIEPSHIESHSNPIHIAPNGSGDGSSWANASGNTTDALIASGWTQAPLWLKEGTYYGDTTAEFAFSVPAGTQMYGGFAGNEDSLEQRDIDLHPTKLDGDNSRAVMTCLSSEGPRAGITLINGMTLTHGYNYQYAALFINKDIKVQQLTICDNHSSNGSVVGVLSGLMQLCKIFGNTSDDHDLVYVSDGTITNCLIANNNSSSAIWTDDESTILQNSIVNNNGWGVTTSKKVSKLRGNIVWGNDSTIHSLDSVSPRIQYCLIESDSSADPMFEGPLDTGQRGYGAPIGNYRLRQFSPCIDAGEKSKGGQTLVDLDGRNRFIHNRADQGCYESDYPVGIDNAEKSPTFTLYPNPAHGQVSLSGNMNAINQVSIYDMTGRKVSQFFLDDSRTLTTLNLGTFAPGVYLLKAGDSTQRLVIY